MRFSAFQLCSSFRNNSTSRLMDQCNSHNSNKDNSSKHSNLLCHRGIAIVVILRWFSSANSSSSKCNYHFYSSSSSSNNCSKSRSNSNNSSNSCLVLNPNNPTRNSSNNCKWALNLPQNALIITVRRSTKRD